jgi:polyhydroxyalkanoate synthesis regulator phasin
MIPQILDILDELVDMIVWPTNTKTRNLHARIQALRDQMEKLDKEQKA